MLDQDDTARTRWDMFTIDHQHLLLRCIQRAKQEIAQIKRACELAEKIRTRSLYGDKP